MTPSYVTVGVRSMAGAVVCASVIDRIAATTIAATPNALCEQRLIPLAPPMVCS